VTRRDGPGSRLVGRVAPADELVVTPVRSAGVMPASSDHRRPTGEQREPDASVTRRPFRLTPTTLQEGAPMARTNAQRQVAEAARARGADGPRSRRSGSRPGGALPVPARVLFSLQSSVGNQAVAGLAQRWRANAVDAGPRGPGLAPARRRGPQDDEPRASDGPSAPTLRAALASRLVPRGSDTGPVDRLEGDRSLEDVRVDRTASTPARATPQSAHGAPIQRVRESEFVADPGDFMGKNVVLFEYGKGFLLKYPLTVKAIGERIPENDLLVNVKDLMVRNKDVMSFYLLDSGTKARSGAQTQDEKNIYYTTPAVGRLPDPEVKSIFKHGETLLDDADDLVATLKDEDAGGDVIRANYAPYFIESPNAIDKKGGKDPDVWQNVGKTMVDPRVTEFVFTDAMNGCAYAITAIQGDNVTFEAWHFQSETTFFDEASHFRATKEIRDWFGVNDYYIGDGNTNLAATNIIWNSDDGTKMLSQKNVIPIKGQGQTSFLESTSHDLNVSEDLTEDRLDEVHRKLKSGIGKRVSQTEVNRINQDVQALVLDLGPASTSMKRIRVGRTDVSDDEVKEISRISDNIAAQKKLGIYPNDLGIFDDLAGLKQELIDISSPSKFWWIDYDETQTIPLKGKFLQASTALFNTVLGLVGAAKNITVTTNSDELNQNLVSLALKIKFYFDMYQDYGVDYTRAASIATGLGILATYKKEVALKNTTLSGEKARLFPADQ
jgi:hypothetical protein